MNRFYLDVKTGPNLSFRSVRSLNSTCFGNIIVLVPLSTVDVPVYRPPVYRFALFTGVFFRAIPSPRFTGGMPVYRGGSFFHARGAPPAAIEAVQAWAELEYQLEIVEALTKDATDVLNERVNGTFADDANPSDNELELAGTENVESEGGRRLAPPPPFSELSSLFGPLEKYAVSCGISGAAYHLRKAKMDFIHARSSKPAV